MTWPRAGWRGLLLTRPATWLFGLVAASLVTAFALAFGLSGDAWVAAGYAAGAGALAGIAGAVWRYRPARPTAWLLLAASVPLFLVAGVRELARGPTVTPPGPAEWVALLGYPLAAAGLLIMVRCQVPPRDAAGLLDALILMPVLAYPVWIFVLAPSVEHSPWPVGTQIAAIVPPVFDLVLLGLLVCVLVNPAGRRPSWWLLAVGVVICTAADAWVSLVRVGRLGSPTTPGWTAVAAAGWIGFALCWAAAALHPSMRLATQRVPMPHLRIRPARLAWLTATILVIPTIMLVRLVRSERAADRPGVVLGMCAVVLVMARLSLILADHRRFREREGVLLSADSRLAAALTVEQVTSIVTSTATRLVGTGVEHEALIYRPPEGAEPPAGAVPTTQLPPQLAAQLPGFDRAVVLPLETGAAGVRLVVAATERVLAGLGASLKILADNAAANLNRIALGAEITRREAHHFFQALVQNESDAIFILGEDLHVRYASPSAGRMFGAAAGLGRAVAQAIGPAYAADVAAWAAGHAPADRRRLDWSMKDAAGAGIEVEATMSDLREDPAVNGVVLSLRNVTKARRLQAELHWLAYHDRLTGLPNRSAFISALDDAVRQASGRESVSVVLADIDEMREVNDQHGHGVGDEVLCATADLLRTRLADADVLARIGGDEFAILQVRAGAPAPPPDLLPGPDGASAALTVGPVQVTTSGSIATAGPGASGPSLLADAEIALRAAKVGRRIGNWRRFDPMLRAEVEREAAYRAGIDRALADGSFVMFYQPIVVIDSSLLGGFEALIRWPQPNGASIMPDQFIQVAESSGQIIPIGRWALRTAATQAASWNRMRTAAGLLPLRLAVNVAAPQLGDPAFRQTVVEALADSGLDPDSLVLEVTERSLLQRSGATSDNIRVLHDAGVRLSLDDFGTGYSSLSYLRDLPVTSLKIDKSFTADVVTSPRQAALVRGIIDIAKALGLVVIAEGVETEEQRARLAELGADLGQGYLFSRPLPFGAAAAQAAAAPTDAPILRRETARDGLASET